MEKDLGSRKVQCVGRGSFVISLPKEWVHEMKISKGSELIFKVLDDGSALLIPRKAFKERESEKPTLKEYWLHVRPEDDPASLHRKITALYVVGADIMHLRFRDKVSLQKHRATVNHLVKNNLLGSEIIDESENEITIRILINHPNLPVEMAIRRMAVLALAANKEVVSALKSEGDNFVKVVSEIYSDVSRLNLYVIRQLKYHLERGLLKDLGFKSPKEFLGYRIVANDIKNIAGNALNLANNILSLKKLIEDKTLVLKETLDEEVYMQITDFCSLMHQTFEETLKVMFKRDYGGADEIFSKIEKYSSIESNIAMTIFAKKLDPNIALTLGLILDAVRRIMEYCQNIAEITLNRTIEDFISQYI
ncbi:MAG: AbrB/MazE/SpoVT family DNA-binding domain-containing protein [Nitrososphaerota archaeon]|nr:AbrB/MazE/SpoVT family DNA-binding domain-containing protein [Candidatus Bathyarchaeota archaeon]MDW8049180.1 AbrB/MazE/SpoVT family DNA-binding domain-containing protein [Nitrososphaerota archaeon]